MSAGLIAVIVLLLFPLGWASWKQQQARAHVIGMRDALRELRDELAEMRIELAAQRDAHRSQLAELAERLDFAERALARTREQRHLPPGEPRP